jgi:hypothetical protein
MASHWRMIFDASKFNNSFQGMQYIICFLERLAHFSRAHSLGLVGNLYDMAYGGVFY